MTPFIVATDTKVVHFLLLVQFWLRIAFHMDFENSTLSELKSAILADSQLFLAKLQTGASDEQLNTVLDRMKQRNNLLIAIYGLKLRPEFWNILQSRLVNRKHKDIVDTAL